MPDMSHPGTPGIVLKPVSPLDPPDQDGETELDTTPTT